MLLLVLVNVRRTHDAIVHAVAAQHMQLEVFWCVSAVRCTYFLPDLSFSVSTTTKSRLRDEFGGVMTRGLFFFFYFFFFFFFPTKFLVLQLP